MEVTTDTDKDTDTAAPKDTQTSKTMVPSSGEISPASHPNSTLVNNMNSPCNNGMLPCLLSRRQQKIGLLIFSLLYIPLFAGAFFGFGPMQIMLEESGAYASLCNDKDNSATQTQEVCPAQTAQLLTM
jgi:hypothetical protein